MWSICNRITIPIIATIHQSLDATSSHWWREWFDRDSCLATANWLHCLEL